MSALGGQIEAMVRTSPECAWSATTNATWLQVQPASGQGEVAITLQVAENKLPNERIGAIHVNGLDVMLAAAGNCARASAADSKPDACAARPNPDARPDPDARAADACTAGPDADADSTCVAAAFSSTIQWNRVGSDGHVPGAVVNRWRSFGSHGRRDAIHPRQL